MDRQGEGVLFFDVRVNTDEGTQRAFAEDANPPCHPLALRGNCRRMPLRGEGRAKTTNVKATARKRQGSKNKGGGPYPVPAFRQEGLVLHRGLRVGGTTRT